VDNAELKEASVITSESESDATDATRSAKKKFVIPEISQPVDVLEATTFFQTTTSGTIPPP